MQIKILPTLKLVSLKVWPGMTSLNGVRKRRLTAKETSIANCEVLDEKYRIAVQRIFLGIIIKKSRLSLIVRVNVVLNRTVVVDSD